MTYQQQLDEQRNDINKLRRHMEELEKILRESIGKNMELQGKVATLAGRLHGIVRG